MIQNKLILFWACFLTILALIAPLTVSFLSFIPGLLLMWFLYGCFFLGAALNKLYTNTPSFFMEMESPKKKSIIIIISALIFYPLYIKFYTGNDVSSVFSNLLKAESNYASYQKYFASEELNKLTITKLPFTIMHGVFKFILVVYVFRVYGFKKIKRRVDLVVIAVLVVMMLLVSVARGTSFELFEIILIFAFALLVKRSRLSRKNWYSKKSIVYLGIIGLIFVILFSINMSLRAGGNALIITYQLQYDVNAIVTLILPGFSTVLYQIAGYFSFGIYFTSIGLTEISLRSFTGFAAMLLPNGLTTFGISESYYSAICDKFIDCSAAWIPDVNVQMNQIGLVGLILMVFLLGRISKSLYVKMLKGSIPATVLLYFIALYMISLPVGNFILASSANILAILIGIVFYYFPSVNKLLYKDK